MHPSLEGGDNTLQQRWEEQARNWVRWARQPGHDSYWRFHRDAFLSLLPPPGRLTLDVGCGEGRLARDLKARGHQVMAIDASPTLVAHAREADPSMDVRLGDGARLPLPDQAADLVLAFMSLQDMDDMVGAVREAFRVLGPEGRFCLAVVHPLNSAGKFSSEAADAPFTIAGDYFARHLYSDAIDRDGLPMTFHSQHRPLEGYFSALEQAGFLVEAVREVTVGQGSLQDPRDPRWLRIPLFLHVRALKPA
ncbi:MAG TPA: class I SAM-dependent methyltransferase [Candidatus Eisenbacteria bacterium]|nr:class I SAM-dependent methyltransferase [Candidatus Eisenbacteria bacterium]